jgi:[ribosomal protein S5]-alanine N-acetyltransferase
VRTKKIGDVEKPTLTAGPWTVRPTDDADREGIAEAGRDPLIQLMPWFGTKWQDTWAVPWIARAKASWDGAQHWVFSILDAEQRYVGSVVFSSGGFRSGGEDCEDGLEVACWTLPAHRGHGAATSALRVLLPWVHEQLRPARIWAKVRDRNAASLRVLEKSGFARMRSKGEFIHLEWVVPSG